MCASATAQTLPPNPAYQYQRTNSAASLASQISSSVVTNPDATITYTVTMPPAVNTRLQGATLHGEPLTNYVSRIVVQGAFSVAARQRLLARQMVQWSNQLAQAQSQISPMASTNAQ